jgi:crotonobetainyl-CoA:carnitine CoA-transferase CaiB-like acyl-CoA transferase
LKERSATVTRILEGVRVIEISAWAYVPSAGAVLAEWGADVIKIEPPNGDPIRGLVSAGVGSADGLSYPWEAWNRGKRALSLDLSTAAAQEIVLRLCEQADVLLTSYLPAVRDKLGFGVDTVRERNPSIVYAAGTGQGPLGPEGAKGGYDSITFWSRGGVSASVTPPGNDRPVGMPAGAFGDSLSGMALAGGIAAALVRKARTGEGAEVYGSLLGTAMWSMQMGILAEYVTSQLPQGVAPPPAPLGVYNPLVNTYRTSDDRFVALCMLQPDVYFDGLVRAIGRDDMVADARFGTPEARQAHGAEIIAELERTFAFHPLSHWRERLATQKGQWDVVQLVGELRHDAQALANGFVQGVDYGDRRSLPLVASPIQFDLTPPTLRPAPGFAAHADEVLAEIGMDVESIIQAKIDGAVI